MSPYESWMSPPPPVSVPLILDGVVRDGPVHLARCVYFSIVADEPGTDWLPRLQGADVPFLMLGLQGIIHRQAAAESEFIHRPFETCVAGTPWLRTDRSLHFTVWTDGTRVEARARPPA